MAQPFETRIRQIMSGQTRGLGAGLARIVLACVEPIYTAIVGARNRLFDRELINISRLPCPVISVGNVTTGGTGKTPVVQWVVRELQTMKLRPCVLLRGYKRADTSTSSDEEQLLRDSLGVPVFADPKRVWAGHRALQAHPDINAFVLDDGFQHRQLARDLDIVLVDATNPFGYGHVLPRGMLRESLTSISRANVVILTRCDLVLPEQLDEIEHTIRGAHRFVPIMRSIHRLDQVSGSGTSQTLADLAGMKIWAFSGIGNPDAFENALRLAGVELAGVTRFGDHHSYDADDYDQLQRSANEAGAQALLTTEKDFVKLREIAAMLPTPVPLLTVRVRIEMSPEDSSKMRDLLKQALCRGHG